METNTTLAKKLMCGAESLNKVKHRYGKENLDKVV